MATRSGEPAKLGFLKPIFHSCNLLDFVWPKELVQFAYFGQMLAVLMSSMQLSAGNESLSLTVEPRSAGRRRSKRERRGEIYNSGQIELIYLIRTERAIE